MQAFPLRTRFHRQELSNILWALATLQHELPEAVLRDVSEEFVRLALRQLSTPEAGRYAWRMWEDWDEPHATIFWVPLCLSAPLCN